MAFNSFHSSTGPCDENDNKSIFLAFWVVIPCELLAPFDFKIDFSLGD